MSVQYSSDNMQKKRKKLRLQNYDYSQNGMYFVTICTQNKKHFFGKITNDEMKLNQCGKIVYECLVDIPNHFDDVIVNEFVIMPNHIHAIIEIVVDRHVCPLQRRQQQLLPKVIGGFKASVTKNINNKFGKNNFKWQRSYYDHIIRKEESLKKIQEYIMINFSEWKKYKLYKTS